MSMMVEIKPLKPLPKSSHMHLESSDIVFFPSSFLIWNTSQEMKSMYKLDIKKNATSFNQWNSKNE